MKIVPAPRSWFPQSVLGSPVGTLIPVAPGNTLHFTPVLGYIVRTQHVDVVLGDK